MTRRRRARLAGIGVGLLAGLLGGGCGHPPRLPPPAPPAVEPVPAPAFVPTVLPRVRVQDRQFVTGETIWRWRGVTAFRLAELVATGQQEVAGAYLAWAAAEGITVVRVLTMAKHLFELSPADGLRVLDRTLELAATYGVYVEVVLLADSASYFDEQGRRLASAAMIEDYVQAVGVILAANSNSLCEGGNEPRHPTQLDLVGNPEYLQSLLALIPPEVPCALGAAHGPDDESRAYVGGSYVTVHADRNDGCGTEDRCWRSVRHTNEQRALQEEVGKPVVNDEPSRTLARDQQVALGAFTALFGLGDTFHYAGGLQAEIPVGAEFEAFEARRRGWRLIPDDWWGMYRNAGQTGSPVEGFVGAVRVYSSVRGDEAYVLGLGVEPEAAIVFDTEAWSVPTLIHEEGEMRLWHVAQR